MPFAIREDVRLYWKLDGAPDLPVLILLNSIGTDMALWETSVPHLLPAFRLLRIDTRGHGASDAPDGDYSLAMLADDVIAVMDAAGVQTAAIAGVSLGGMIAMELALTYPTRLPRSRSSARRRRWTRARGATGSRSYVRGVRRPSPTWSWTGSCPHAS